MSSAASLIVLPIAKLIAAPPRRPAMNDSSGTGLVRLAKQQQKSQQHHRARRKQERHARILPSPRRPRDVARAFVGETATHSSGALVLRHWRGGWWVWRASHWEEAEP